MVKKAKRVPPDPSLGGRAVVDKYGSGHMRELAKSSHETSPRDRAFYQRIGRKGGSVPRTKGAP